MLRKTGGGSELGVRSPPTYRYLGSSSRHRAENETPLRETKKEKPQVSRSLVRGISH